MPKKNVIIVVLLIVIAVMFYVNSRNQIGIFPQPSPQETQLENFPQPSPQETQIENCPQPEHTCPACYEPGVCSTCGGTGKMSYNSTLLKNSGFSLGLAPSDGSCVSCRGSGKCKRCEGTGTDKHKYGYVSPYEK